MDISVPRGKGVLRARPGGQEKRHLSLKTKAGAVTSQMMDKVVEIRDEVIPRWSALQAQLGLEVSKAKV
jgi:hypothetical protein